MEEKRSLEDIATDFLMHKHGHYLERPLTPDEFRAALIQAYEWGETARWLAVADCQPTHEWRCLVRCKEPDGQCYEAIADYEGGAWHGVREQEYVTHWMPIPPPPPEGK